ncbi:agamous-like MADS-box protein AGL29 [Aristolochia californica]|uniref:agamous-like MADS-box protein AGL29 n=1 Tax=Aristolochia californica TaxID=171875 RepID=UPI0035DA8E52
MGKRRTEIKEIQENDRRQVTFSKRRKGLFKKAAELSVLTGAQVAMFAFSPGGKIFTFGQPSVDAVVDAYLGGSTGSISGTTRCCDEEAEVIMTSICDLQRQIDVEKGKNRVVEELKMNASVCEASAACQKIGIAG